LNVNDEKFVIKLLTIL